MLFVARHKLVRMLAFRIIRSFGVFRCISIWRVVSGGVSEGCYFNVRRL